MTPAHLESAISSLIETIEAERAEAVRHSHTLGQDFDDASAKAKRALDFANQKNFEVARLWLADASMLLGLARKHTRGFLDVNDPKPEA